MISIKAFQDSFWQTTELAWTALTVVVFLGPCGIDEYQKVFSVLKS